MIIAGVISDPARQLWNNKESKSYVVCRMAQTPNTLRIVQLK